MLRTHVLLAALILALSTTFAQEPAPSSGLTTLQALVESMSSLREQLQTQQAKAKSGDTAAIQDVPALQQRLTQAQRDFEIVATGVDRVEFDGKTSPSKLDLAGEFNELMQPFMNEVKAATEQPRVIEGLRSQVASHQKKLALADRALQNLTQQLQTLAKAKENPPEATLKRQLTTLQEQWKDTRQQTDAALQVVEHQLAETLAKRKSIWQIATEGARLFFLTRGRNFLLALLAVCAAYFLWRWLYQRIIRYSPWHRQQGGDKPFIARAMDVAHYIAGFGLCVLAALTVLYSTGDWLLLGLCLISLIGLGLATKTGLPKYYRQARLMLNLGEVREGERIVLGGLSWQVRTLGAFSTLVNPSVRNGILRVPLTHLMNLTSRVHNQGEPWFPCKEGDWVQLADSTFGRVVCITPEFVQIVQLGGAHKTYPTARFLNENPVNYTGGFRTTTTLRLDHSLRLQATDSIPATLRTTLQHGLLTLVDPTELKSLKVEYRHTTPVALEIEIIADFAGSVAEQHPALQRALQRYALEACTEHDWPLASQLIHLPNG
jgi:uncharacterized coiled-coil protein SlyX